LLGAEPSGTGTVTVTGDGSTWNNNPGGFLVALSGHGFLNIEDGGVINGHTGALALAPSGVAAAVVTGSGSRWNNSGSVWVGGGETGPGGDATLNVSDGAVVTVGVGRDLMIWQSGTLDGDGTIEGHVQNEGIVAPGNSSGVLTVTGNYTQRNDARYLVEIFGSNQGTEYDLLDVGGVANLAGTLDVDFGDPDYTPALGDTFEILKATGGVVGSFDNESLPAIGQNVRLTTIYGPDTVTLAVVPIQIGDFNANGVVDAADYVVWRSGLGTTYTQADYDVWRANFGQTIGSGGALPSADPLPIAVPEPAILTLLIMAMVAHYARRSSTVW
jgi:T5SS/PEP-CTERM-associated repeat protein